MRMLLHKFFKSLRCPTHKTNGFYDGDISGHWGSRQEGGFTHEVTGFDPSNTPVGTPHFHQTVGHHPQAVRMDPALDEHKGRQAVFPLTLIQEFTVCLRGQLGEDTLIQELFFVR